MSESKHTPGPWQWMEVKLNDRIAARLGKARSKVSKKDGLLLYALLGPYNGPCEMNGGLHDYSRIMYMRWSSIRGSEISNATPSKADRSLIAAAPDLLEACQAVLEKLVDIERYGEHHDNPLPTILRAAIAKATGEE